MMSYEIWEQIEARDIIRRSIPMLRPRYQGIMRRLYGIGEPYINSSELARELGVHRERIYQIKRASLLKMRDFIERNEVRDARNITAGN